MIDSSELQNYNFPKRHYYASLISIYSKLK